MSDVSMFPPHTPATFDVTGLTVTQALSCVMHEMPAIGKGDRSPEGYQYRGIEAITKHLQPLLAKYGVVIAPSASITDVRPAPAMKDGWQDVYMQVDWTIYGPDGSSITARTNGVGRDKSDKGSNKAQTQALKYLLLQLLCISDKDDDTDGLTYEHDRVDCAPVADPPSVAVHKRLREVEPGSPKAIEIDRLKVQHGEKLTVEGLAKESWRAVVEGVLDNTALSASAAPVVEGDTP